jgi:hypothetical protein
LKQKPGGKNKAAGEKTIEEILNGRDDRWIIFLTAGHPFF